MERRFRLAWGRGSSSSPTKAASEVLGPQLDDADQGKGMGRSGSSFWSASSGGSRLWSRGSNVSSSSRITSKRPTHVEEPERDDSGEELNLPEKWEKRLAHTMTLRTVQNTMKHANRILQQLTETYGPSSELHMACWAGSLDSVIDATEGSEAIVRDYHSGQRELTPLHIATLCRHADIVEHLLRLGANPNLPGVYNYCALHIASSSSAELCKLLLDAGSKAVVLTDDADTPLHLACCYMQVENIELLLEAQADPSAANHFGVTPLHVAAATAALDGFSIREAKAVLLLCSYGASLTARDRQGKTPGAVARMVGCEASLTEFLQAGTGAPGSFALPGSPNPSGAVDAKTQRIRHMAQSMLAEAQADDLRRSQLRASGSFLDDSRSDPSVPVVEDITTDYGGSQFLQQENKVLKLRVSELEQELHDAKMNMKLLKDSLDLRTLSAQQSSQVDRRFADMERDLIEAHKRIQDHEHERQSWKEAMFTERRA